MHYPFDCRVAARLALQALVLAPALAACAPPAGDLALVVPEELLAVADELDAEWEAVGADPLRITAVSAGPGVPVVLAALADLPAFCETPVPAGTLVAGCVSWGEVEPRAIYVAADSQFAVADLLRHELGHVLRGSDGRQHLDAREGCPNPANASADPPHAMCVRAGKAISASDAAFVVQ
jgi:hypothetical protein